MNRKNLLPLASLVTFIALCAGTAFAQGDFAVTDTSGVPPKPLPTGVILVPGALPSASDSKTPVPEGGSVTRNMLRNAYFGLSYTVPAGWIEEFKGPPPSDTGIYVLAQIVPSNSYNGAGKGSLLITAQDLFFTLTPAKSAAEMIRYSSDHLPSYYQLDREPAEVMISGHRFARFDYSSPVAELHWYVLATQVRCHIVQFVFTSRDPKLIDQLVDGLNQDQLLAENDAVTCVADYARAGNILYKIEPALGQKRSQSIPVRFIIGKSGKVEHVHVISAFADEARTITDALLQWKFKPYTINGEPVAVETGLVFGFQPTHTDTASRATTPE